jgi:hypothetical protein
MIYFKYGDVVRFKLNTEEQGRQRCSGEPEQKKGGGHIMRLHTRNKLDAWYVTK